MSDIFISYSQEDRPKASAIAKALEQHGWSVWWDRKIPTGKSFEEVIEKEITAAKCVMVLWSQFSVKSHWVREEANDGQTRSILAPVLIEEVPHVDPADRAQVLPAGDGFYRVSFRYGFMDEIDVPADLGRMTNCGAPFSMLTTSFFLGRQKLIASKRPGMALWREQLFAWMTKNSESAMEFFGLPTNRVVELGSQLEI